MKRIIIFFILIATLLTSCVVSREQYGNYDDTNLNSTLYAKGKDIYLFWDQVPLQKVEKDLVINDYEKIVKRNLFDAVILYGTAGIFSLYTVKIKAQDIPTKPKM